MGWVIVRFGSAHIGHSRKAGLDLSVEKECIDGNTTLVLCYHVIF